MSLTVSIGRGGRHSVTVEKDTKKRRKARSSKGERDLREVISREVRGTEDLRDRLELVRGALREAAEGRGALREAAEGRGALREAAEGREERARGAPSDQCLDSSQRNLSIYSDEKSDDSKGKENTKDTVKGEESEKQGKEQKSVASEFKKKKKKKRSRSRSKERKPLSDSKDSENRKRKHSAEPDAKDGSKSKKEKRRSTSRDHDEKKKTKKEKKKEKKRSRSRDVKKKDEKDRKRSVSKDRKRSDSKDRKRSDSKDRKRGDSKDRKRSDSKERKRSVSKDRKRSDSKERRRSVSKERRRSVSKERRRSVSKERRRSVSKERRRPVSKDRRRSVSKDRRRSVSKDRKRSDSKGRRRSRSPSSGRKRSAGRKSRIDSGISLTTSASPRETTPGRGRHSLDKTSPRRGRHSPDKSSPRRSSNSPRRGRRSLDKTSPRGSKHSPDKNRRSRHSPDRKSDKKSSPRKNRASPVRKESPARKEKESPRKEKESPRKAKSSPRKSSPGREKESRTKEERSPRKEVREEERSGEAEEKVEQSEPSLSPSPIRRVLEREESQESAHTSQAEENKPKQDEKEDNNETAVTKDEESDTKNISTDDKDAESKGTEEGKTEGEKAVGEAKAVSPAGRDRRSRERRRSGERGRSAGRRRSRSREGRNPYSVYEQKRGRRTRTRRRTRSRSKSPRDLKDEMERVRREQRVRRSRSRSRNRGSRRLSDDLYRRGREGRHRRYSGGGLGHSTSWEDKVESFLQSTSATSNLSAVSLLLPEGFDPSKPPPVCSSVAVCPPDYALTEYSDLPAPDSKGPAPRQLMEVATAPQLHPHLAPGFHQPPPHYPAPLDYPPPSCPPPNYVQTEVTQVARPPQGPSEPYQGPTEAQELAAMNLLNEENVKNRKEENKPLTVKEKKKADKAGKELWQFVAKKLMGDATFCLKAKKKKAKSLEELKEKADKCAVRIAITLEKAGFSELRLWKMIKDNEKGVQGFSTELMSNVANGTIEADVEARSPKHRLDAELLREGSVFRYIGQYIQGNPAGRCKSSSPPAELPSALELQSILEATSAHGPALPSPEELDPLVRAEHESEWDFSNRSFLPLAEYFGHGGVPAAVAEAYCLTLVRAGFNYPRLMATCTNFTPTEPENEGEPPETLYGHLLGCLREISFEKYPTIITDGIDHHTVTIVKKVLEHFVPAACSPVPAAPRPAEEVPPPGANTGPQLPRKKYITMAVSVETIPVEGRMAVWQICLHTPGLPEEQDPDYECLMVPGGVAEGRLTEAGFMWSQERAAWYHQGTEFGRRKAETEEKSIEKLVNYLEILRGGGREAGLNNGLVLLFECTEDLGLVRALLSSHSADIWSDTVRGVGCIDQFVRAADIEANYCPPYWKYAVGEEGQWCTTLYRRGKALRIEAASRGEMVYNILEDILDQCPTYDTFLRWYCHPSQSDAVAGLARHLELIRQLAPLQTHVDRQLFNSRVQCVLEGVFAPRGELEARQPPACVARQAVRRLVSLGFNLDNLKNSFRADASYEIPANVFLQDMTQVQRLRVHAQTDYVRKFIKEFFTPNFHNKF